jgi:hypothetical protein
MYVETNWEMFFDERAWWSCHVTFHWQDTKTCTDITWHTTLAIEWLSSHALSAAMTGPIRDGRSVSFVSSSSTAIALYVTMKLIVIIVS